MVASAASRERRAFRSRKTPASSGAAPAKAPAAARDRWFAGIPSRRASAAVAARRSIRRAKHRSRDGASQPWIIPAMSTLELFNGRRAADPRERDAAGGRPRRGRPHRRGRRQGVRRQPVVGAAVAARSSRRPTDPADDAVYGGGADGRLLAGIMGHNLCLDIFGGPSAEEAAAGLTAARRRLGGDLRLRAGGGAASDHAGGVPARAAAVRAASSSSIERHRPRPRGRSRTSPPPTGRSAGPSTSRSARRFSSAA